MKDYKPLNITQETKDRLMQHNQHPRDTQDDVVNHVLDLVEQEQAEPTEPIPIEDVVGREIPLAEMQDQLDRIEGSLGDTVEKALEIGDNRNPVELEGTERKKIADEVAERLR